MSKESSSIGGGFWYLLTAVYFPMIVLIGVSILFAGIFNLPKPIGEKESKKAVEQQLQLQVQKEVTDELHKQELSKKVADEVEGQIAVQNVTAETGRSEAMRDYVQKLIKVEVQEQTEKTTKDEVEKMKADWKGDLFGQITFPVIFCIVSIFSAFAVKDVLMRILGDNDLKKLEEEIANNLETEVKVHKGDLDGKFETYKSTLESQLNGMMEARIEPIILKLEWLEYETACLTSDSISQLYEGEEIAFYATVRPIGMLANMRGELDDAKLIFKYEMQSFIREFSEKPYLKENLQSQLRKSKGEIITEKQESDLLDELNKIMEIRFPDLQICQLSRLVDELYQIPETLDEVYQESLPPHVRELVSRLKSRLSWISDLKLRSDENRQNDRDVENWIRNDLSKAMEDLKDNA